MNLQASAKNAWDEHAVVVWVAGEEYGRESGLALPEAAVLFERDSADTFDMNGWGRNLFGNVTAGPVQYRRRRSGNCCGKDNCGPTISAATCLSSIVRSSLD